MGIAIIMASPLREITFLSGGTYRCKEKVIIAQKGRDPKKWRCETRALMVDCTTQNRFDGRAKPSCACLQHPTT